MRVLFTSTGGDGHLLPLMPLAQAFAKGGDDVAVAAGANHRERIERAGLRFEQAGPTIEELRPELEAHRERIANVPPAGRRPAAFSGRFAVIEAPRRLQTLRHLIEASRPDVVIHEPADLAAPLAATAAGVQTVHHAFGRPIPEDALRRAAEEMAPLWRSAGLEPDEFAGVYLGSYVEVCPPSFRADLPHGPSRTHDVRPAEASTRDDSGRDRPLVYATLGTSFNELPTFRLLLEAFELVDCDAILTIGRNREPRDLEPLPSNVRVESYIPQDEILPNCDVVLAHAGSGSTLAALAYGRPLVVVPQGADQFENADACEALGLAEKILPADLTVDRVREALELVLGDATYADVARTVAEEIAEMPSPAAAAEDIAAQR
jgi:UDP:flavonoid glycosyltransferase YjiC (YdhE family)